METAVPSPVIYSSRSDEWPTPVSFFADLDAEFGFALDVCASKANAKCQAFYGLDHPKRQRRNGLTQNWAAEAAHLGGAVWMNPPYSACRTWMAKAAESAAAGATVVCLVPARTDTRWWHESVMGSAAEVRLVKGRLRFGDGAGTAPFPSAVIVYDAAGNAQTKLVAA